MDAADSLISCTYNVRVPVELVSNDANELIVP